MKHDASPHEVAGLTWDRVKEQAGRAAPRRSCRSAPARSSMACTCPWPPTRSSPGILPGRWPSRIDALIWPTLTYGAYPAFAAYAGSVSLSNRTFQAVVTEIADALLGFGAWRVIILDTGLSTIAPVEAGR